MSPQAHHIGRLTLDVEVSSFDAAQQLRTRAEDIAWELLPKTLERVFDALAPVDMDVRIERLNLDLGDIAADALEQDIPIALERVLKEALTQALANARHAPSAQARALSTSATLLEDFDTYLVHGTTPWRHAANASDPAQIIQSLIEQQPAALIGMLRRHAGSRNAIERLVLQAGEAGLHALLGILTPTDAQIILAYLDDVQRLHVLIPNPPLAEPPLRRALWVLTLEYLLHEAGTQFNRRTFLATLLEGLAQTEGIAYSALLRMLKIVLAKTRAHRPLGGALPGVLDELLRDLDVDAPLLWTSTHQQRPDFGVMTRDELVGVFASCDTATMNRWLKQATAHQHEAVIRALADDQGWLQRAVSAMDEKARSTALCALSTAHASPVLDDLQVLWQRHRIAPIITLDEGTFMALTWALAFSVLASVGTGSFHREQLRSVLLAGVARYGGMAASALGGWQQLMASVSATQDSHTTPAVPQSSVETPLLLAERFLRTGQPQAMGERLCALAASDPLGFAALLKRLLTANSGKAETLMERLWHWMLPEEIIAVLRPDQTEQAVRWATMLADMPGATMASAWRQVLAAAWQGHDLGGPAELLWPGQRLDRLALLRHWMDGGNLAWWAPSQGSIDALLDELPKQTLAELHAWLGDAEPEQIAWRLRRVYDRLGPSAGLDLLTRLAPWAFSPGGPLAKLTPGLNARALSDLRIRAAAAAVAGMPLDLAQLTRPIASPPNIPAPAQQQPSPPSAAPDRQALLDWLSGNPGASESMTDKSWRVMAHLLDRHDSALTAVLRHGLTTPASRARWAAAMPEEVLARLVHRLEPGRARFVLDVMTLMRTAWRQTAPPGTHNANSRTHWHELLAILAEPQAPTPRLIVRRLQVALLGDSQLAPEHLLTQAQRLAQQGGYVNLIAALQAEPAATHPPQAAMQAPAQAPLSSQKKSPTHRPIEPKNGDVIYVRNAGLVLLNPFLPRFFEYLDVLSKNDEGAPRIIGVEAASRAVHALQYLAAEQCNAPEPDLVLNKLLCGLPIDTPVARTITLSEAEQSVCDNMLQAVIGNWPIIANTSAAGLRETFFEREGRLLRSDDRWTLTVQRKTVDVLVDQIPWSFSIILHPWMSSPLYVAW